MTRISKPEKDNRKKAFLITLISYLFLLLLFLFIRFQSQAPAQTMANDLIEINLGNELNGDGNEQPLIKGNRTLSKDDNFNDSRAPKNGSDQTAEEDGDEDAPGLSNKKTGVNKSNNTSNGDLVNNRKPKLTYRGPGEGNNGNNSEQDNSFRNQGNQKNSNGDNGSPDGDKDSYGDSPGGKTGGPKIIRGNRRIVQQYEFEGDLKRATIYAGIRVTPAGKGSFVKFEKGSTNTGQAYANAISRYLNNIQFNRSNEESIIVVEFFFDIK
jgi:hypothetical protein